MDDMAENADAMVLRSFPLPQGMDDDLRELASALGCAKADLLRFFINQGMEYLADWKSWNPDILRELFQAAQARQADGGSERDG